MSKKRTFISFDYDHDEELKNCLKAQSRREDSPFDIVDMSIKEAIDNNWKYYARRRIRSCDIVVVICGEHTDTANGVSAELEITKEEGIKYFLLKGHSDKTCKKPRASRSSDIMYDWTWDNLKKLFS